MNDRFKFRFFNEYSNKLEFCDDYDLKDIFESGNPVMQCTGIKDKNGKLIYESDIVKYKDEVHGLCIGRIEWDNAHYELQYYADEKYGWFSHILCIKHIKNIEVIGNIYQNKELLEVE